MSDGMRVFLCKNYGKMIKTDVNFIDVIALGVLMWEQQRR